VRISLASPLALTEAQLREAQSEVEELARRRAPVDALGVHPWGAVRGVTWTNALEDQVHQALGEARSALEGVERTAAPLSAALGVGVPASTQQLRSLVSLAETLAQGPVPAVALEAAWPEVLQRTKLHAVALREQSEREQHLASRWKPELFSQDLPALHARFQRWAGAFFLFALLFLWGARKLLAAVALRALPPNREIEQDLGTARKLLEQRPLLGSQRDALAGALSGVPPSDLERAETVEALLARSCQARELRDALGAAGVQLPAEPASREALREQAREFRSALDRLLRAEEALTTLLKVRPWAPVTAPDHRASLGRQVDAWRSGLRAFRPWCLYAAQAERLRGLGHGDFVDAVEAQAVPAARLGGVFERAVLSAWLRVLQDEQPVLRDFEGSAHAARIERFRRPTESSCRWTTECASWSCHRPRKAR
ncbi:MAG: hypothetical protein L0Y66_02500, partial [Myxococcaceae bacterium]|nr:hypothetical protein [Myxococcaceae bacterium]